MKALGYGRLTDYFQVTVARHELMHGSQLLTLCYGRNRIHRKTLRPTV